MTELERIIKVLKADLNEFEDKEDSRAKEIQAELAELEAQKAIVDDMKRG